MWCNEPPRKGGDASEPVCVCVCVCVCLLHGRFSSHWCVQATLSVGSVNVRACTVGELLHLHSPRYWKKMCVYNPAPAGKEGVTRQMHRIAPPPPHTHTHVHSTPMSGQREVSATLSVAPSVSLVLFPMKCSVCVGVLA